MNTDDTKVTLEELLEASGGELLSEARALGINTEDHQCGCEACGRTSALCTATRSSLALAILEKTK